MVFWKDSPVNRKHSRTAGWFDFQSWRGKLVLETRASPKVFWLIVVAAVAVRLLVLKQLADNYPAFSQPIVDSRWHYLWAKEIAAGNWLGSEVFFRAPLYSYMLGAWIAVVGDGLWPIRIMQACLGGLVCGLTYLIGVKAFGRKVGLIAGLGSIFYGPMIYYQSELLLEVLAIPLSLWAVWLAMTECARPIQRGYRWLIAGLVLGLTAITRPNYLLVVPAFWYWSWPLRDGAPRTAWQKIRSPLLLTLGLTIPIVPVAIRNYVVAQDTILISYQGGVNLWLGNNPEADGVTMQMPEIALDEGVEWDEFVETTDSIAQSVVGRPLQPSEISSFWSARAVDWMLTNPIRAVTGWLEKTYYLFNGYEVGDQTDIYEHAKFSSVLNLLIGRLAVYLPCGLIAPFALIGLGLAWRQSRVTRALVVFVVLYALTVILFLATARHRLPLTPLLTIFAAASAVMLFEMIRTHAWKALVAPSIALVLLLVGLNVTKVEAMLKNPAFWHYQLGLAHDRNGDYDAAIVEYENAIAAEPRHLASYKNLGYDLVRVGAYDSAVAVTFRYLSARQDDAEAYNNLGLAYLGQADTARAEGSFRVAIQKNRTLPHPHFNLGEIANARGDAGKALGYYRNAIGADSTFAPAYSAMAIIYAVANNDTEAEVLLLTGLRHAPDHAILLSNLGSLYLRLGRAEKALPHLERAVYWQPQSEGTRVNLAVAYLRLEQLEKAKEQLRAVLKLNPQNESATRLLKDLDEAFGPPG